MKSPTKPALRAIPAAKSCCPTTGTTPVEDKVSPARLIRASTGLSAMLATKIMAPTQRTTGPVAAPKIIVIMFTMTAMVGNRLRQIKAPRLDAYQSGFPGSYADVP